MGESLMGQDKEQDVPPPATTALSPKAKHRAK